ncbi:hypothetical protein PGT21_027634 [Puccinia graminis f. sp. tritici]|uniref:Uncharacterized protein n=1 Tax=Puccinia graminis f. sp. tritici TaxID=56615 RepID=A0A5B0NDB2_PUCGR|nr:hypothetical protein PGT21_027634 [Puccinia graminis f. sp. tritici]
MVLGTTESVKMEGSEKKRKKIDDDLSSGFCRFIWAPFSGLDQFQHGFGPGFDFHVVSRRAGTSTTIFTASGYVIAPQQLTLGQNPQHRSTLIDEGQVRIQRDISPASSIPPPMDHCSGLTGSKTQDPSSCF